LGLKKGLKAYLDHIPSGLRNLQHAASQVASLPRLQELTGEEGALGSGFGYWNLRIRPGIPNANRGDRGLTGDWP